MLTHLDEHGLEYELHTHPPLPTIELALEYWKEIDSVHCKNLFFRNHKGNRHYLVVFECHKELAIHSLEHMFATYVRNSEYSDNIIYFGPMGCQTGVYLLVRGLDNCTVLKLVKDVLNKIINHNGEIFGNTREECGNYRNLNLSASQIEAERYLSILNSKEVTFKYE